MWPEDERPRERLVKYGSENLSDAQLLAILLRTGLQNTSAVELARNIIKHFEDLTSLEAASISELCSIKGISTAKAVQIKAGLEIGKRSLSRKKPIQKKFKSSKEIADYYMPYLKNLKKEIFKVVLLNGRNKFIKDVTISQGSLNASLVHPREIIKEAIKESASALIFIHNHPSGEPKPTKSDMEITNRLIKACDLVGLRVLDHIIIGDNKYVSFLDKGLIKEV